MAKDREFGIRRTDDSEGAGRRLPSGSAKVSGDRDEAKALPDDVAVNTRGGPDADMHHPAAATVTADEEAGADPSSSSGRIEPLRPKPPGSGSGRA